LEAAAAMRAGFASALNLELQDGEYTMDEQAAARARLVEKAVTLPEEPARAS
jgi:hypothetical protein